MTMAIQLATQSANDRFASIFNQTATLDKSLKFTACMAKLASSFAYYLPISAVALSTIELLGKNCSSIRTGIKVFDVCKDVANPSSKDKVENRLKWLQSFCFFSADSVGPVLYFEEQGHYSLDDDLKKDLGFCAASVGAFGLCANLTLTSYQISKMSSDLQTLIADTSETSINGMKHNIAQVRANVTGLVDHIANLRALHPCDLSIHAIRALPEGTDVQQLKLVENDLNRCLDDLAGLEAEVLYVETNKEVAKGAVLDKLHKSYLTIVEKVIDITVIVLSLSAAFVAPVFVAPFTLGATLAFLSVISSGIALKKIWNDSALTDSSKAQQQEFLAQTKRMAKNYNDCINNVEGYYQWAASFSNLQSS